MAKICESFWFFFSFLEQKQLEKSNTYECFALFPVLFSSCSCGNPCYYSNFFFMCLRILLLPCLRCWECCFLLMVNILFHSKVWQSCAYGYVCRTNMWKCISLFECRWRADILALLLCCLACLAMHTLNFVQSTQWTNERILNFSFLLPSSALFSR